MRISGLLLPLILSLIEPVAAAGNSAADTWRTYRFGLFVHWGVASGKALPQSHSHARNSLLNPSGSIPAEVYDQYFQEFNPTQYDPDTWTKLAHQAGMRYAVFVAKHHDGFSMYASAVNPYNIMRTPYGKDVARMFVDACRRQGIAPGWQISPKDWKNPDFNTASHDRYNQFYETVIEELATGYGPLSVMWFDGIEPVGPDKWKDTPAKVAALLHKTNPQIMLGNHGGAPEDFVSFEDLVGPFDRTQPWEMTEQINPSGWVFNKPMPTRPFRELLRNLVYTISRDGNYLLDVGPMPDGRIYPPDAERLGDFANWMTVNAEAVHGTRGGPYRDGDWGGATCKGDSVYLFLSDRVGAELSLAALPAKVKAARRLDAGPLQWKSTPKGLQLRLGDRSPSNRPVFSVVRLDLDRNAYSLPLIDGQANLAAAATLTPSSIRDNDKARWGTALLFDNQGGTAWDTDPSLAEASLELDLGSLQSIGSLSMAQINQRQSWSGYFDYEWKIREDARAAWQSAFKARGTLGQVPIIELPAPVRARYLRLELKKLNKARPVQLGELRVFAPLGRASLSAARR